MNCPNPTTAIGIMHKHFCKDRACGSGDMLAERQTDRQTHAQTDTQTCSLQYFSTAVAGERKLCLKCSSKCSMIVSEPCGCSETRPADPERTSPELRSCPTDNGRSGG